jgi:hypothetical protein
MKITIQQDGGATLFGPELTIDSKELPQVSLQAEFAL